MQSPMPLIDTTDAPFLTPLDIVLDLPAPPSINKLRKIDWWNHKRASKWRRLADGFVLAAKGRTRDPIKLKRIHRFELHITMSEAHTRIDLDNGIKCLIDYLHAIELIENDAPKNMRRLTVEWGRAPEGCRVLVRPCA